MNQSLFEIIKKQDVVKIKELLKTEQNMYTHRNMQGDTLLHAALETENLEIIDILLNAGFNINSVDASGDTILHIAVSKNKLHIVKYLLAHQANPNIQDDTQYTPAFYAIKHKNFEILDLLKDNGADFFITGYFNGSLLHEAARVSSDDVILYFIKQGLDINGLSINKETPLGWAMYGNNTKVIDVLIAHGATINNTFDIWGNTIFTAAILASNPDSILALIKKGVNINEKNPEGRTPLHMTVSPANHRIDAEIVKILINNGADVNAVRYDGISVLMWAITSCNFDIIKILIEAGAKIENDTCTVDKKGNTILHYAIQTGVYDIIYYFLERCKNLDVKNNTHKTPLYLAVEKGLYEIVKVLINKKCSLSVHDTIKHMTLLHKACEKGYIEIVEILLANGLDKNILDSSNKTAYMYAQKYGHHSICILLDSISENTNMQKIENFKFTDKLLSDSIRVWYLGHSGWAVKTKKNILIFDYCLQNSQKPITASIINGHINPSEIDDLPVTVFVSSIYPDHFDTEIFSFEKSIKRITYIYGFNLNKKNKPYQGPQFIEIGLNTTKIVNEVEITTVLSTAGGAGFFVTVDGFTLYHAGDHSNRQSDLSGPFCGEIDILAQKNNSISCAFLPIQGSVMASKEIIALGNDYTISKLNPSYIFPMHCKDEEENYLEYAFYVAKKFPRVVCNVASCLGDSFDCKKKPS